MVSKIFEAGSVFNELSKCKHQRVVFCNDEDTGLKAIIAIHNTTLGPAFGGTRMWEYKTEGEALRDVLRLSRAMTYKAAISGLNLGGGKALILGNSRTDKTEALMRRLGRFIKNLSGSFITAEDLGTNNRDMEYIRMETEHVVGGHESSNSSNSSAITARGVFMGIKACLKELYGSDSLAGRSVAVQGIGHVGENLVHLLREENARVYVSDIDEERVRQVAKKTGADAISNNNILDLEFDVYSPCALGGIINSATIAKMRCAIIAGSANNQLADEDLHGQMLLEKGILYAPDYLINAGGMINSYSEISGYSKKRTLQLAENIYDATRVVLKKSKAESIPSNKAADMIAEKRISDIKKIKASY
ncbi:Glu/Leu/Phe/Val dehydrogenase [Paradesertivirga mongoliensis]|uniref:Glu/Leu/Phe/Val dehydrogenase n=1 Tax=Paradesertivirga mongoliensis TaxID=2100740 RepID=A0ABW4ZLG2_9SPHI|nr:Glu/Leu/Phe/Val dehydrogenase dimerization domain-containing protein [Pedobacter mongoliensis]